MKFLEVAHLYVGAPCLIGDRNWKRPDISDRQRAPHIDPDYGKPITSTIDLHTLSQYIYKTTPILKRLIDLTEEDILQLIRYIYHGYTDKLEKAHMFKVVISENRRVGVVKFTEGDLPETFHFYTYRRWSPEQFTYLLRQGYDLFGLIDADEAIDAKTWKKE